MHVGSRRIRSASVWLRAALFGGGMHLDVLFATQLVGILSRLSNRRVLTWSTRSGSPAQALHAWLLSRTSDWKWTHDITRHSLDLTVAGEPGARQHSVRDAWRAWCLQRHMSSLRRDADLDCFDEHGCFHRIDWEATRTFASSGPEARAISTGACFSPAALGGCVDVWLRLAFGLVVRNMARLITSLGLACVAPVLLKYRSSLASSYPLVLGGMCLTLGLTWLLFNLGLCMWK